MTGYLELSLVAALTAWLITPAVAALGRLLGAYGNLRGTGEIIRIPRLGGLGILLAILGTAGLAVLLPSGFRAGLGIDGRWAVRFLVPAVLVLLIGVYDDLRGATPVQKLAVQMVAAAVAWWLGIRMTAWPFTGPPIESAALSLVLTVLWIVAVTNALNLLDGLDGLAASVALLVSLTLCVVSLLQGDRLVAIVAVVLAGAILGFLRFNAPAAKVYLGDTGSLFLGCMLATLALATATGPNHVSRTVPYVSLGLPLLDVVLSVARRIIKGQPIFTADCNHVHHRLLATKRSVGRALLTLCAVAAACSLGSLLVLYWTRSEIVLGFSLVGLAAWLVFGQLRYEEFDFSRAIAFAHRIFLSSAGMRQMGTKTQTETMK